MKNIHILPTDKPSFGKYLVLNKEGKLCIWNTNTMGDQKSLPVQHIYITSDEEIKEGGYVFWEDKIYTYGEFMKMKTPVYTDYFSIILTTDRDLIKDGVQAIDDEFLEWFVKNPSCEFVEVDKIPDLQSYNEKTNKCELVYVIIIPQEEYKQETLEEAAENYLHKVADGKRPTGYADEDFIEGAKWQAERMYSEEEVRQMFNRYNEIIAHRDIEEWQPWIEKQFKKK